METEGEDRVDDDDLLRRCQRGDDAALTELVRRFEGRIFRLAYRVLQDTARAEDAAADALANVWLRCRSWRGDAAAGTWIQQVAWRVVLDHHRRRRRWWRFWQPVHAEGSSSKSDPLLTFAEQENQKKLEAQIRTALANLPAEDRALVHWHYFDGQTLAEIALVMNVSRDALKMRLSRARQKLRGILGEDHGTT
jgi:RNA polymerase sigma-70 factor (ECF subfamily)